MEQISFNDWLNTLLSNNPLPNNTMAVNFNIYDFSEETYDVQLIASNLYDENDDDWACEEIYSSNENCFYFNKSDFEYRELVLENVIELVAEYLENGLYSDMLKTGIAITAGFVDDSLDCIWISEDDNE